MDSKNWEWKLQQVDTSKKNDPQLLPTVNKELLLEEDINIV